MPLRGALPLCQTLYPNLRKTLRNHLKNRWTWPNLILEKPFYLSNLSIRQTFICQTLYPNLIQTLLFVILLGVLRRVFYIPRPARES